MQNTGHCCRSSSPNLAFTQFILHPDRLPFLSKQPVPQPHRPFTSAIAPMPASSPISIFSETFALLERRAQVSSPASTSILPAAMNSPQRSLASWRTEIGAGKEICFLKLRMRERVFASCL